MDGIGIKFLENMDELHFDRQVKQRVVYRTKGFHSVCQLLIHILLKEEAEEGHQQQ